MTIAAKHDDAIGTTAEAPPIVLVEEVVPQDPDSAPIDRAVLHAQALLLVQRAIDAGSVEVAMKYLALEGQWAMARRRRRRGWVLAALAAFLMFAMVGGAVAYQGLQGGNTGENAPEPLGFGDAPTAPLDQGATGTGDVESATAPPDGVGVLGANQEASVDPSLGVPIPTGTAAGVAPSTGSTGASAAVRSGAAPASGGSAARPVTPTAGAVGGVGASTPGAVAPTPAPTVPVAPAGGALDGSWSVIGGSQAGYRVNKRWTFTGTDEVVVGRTTKVSGSMTVAQDRVSATSVIIDMASVDSANGIRDAAYRQDILNVASNPTSRFDLTGPIVLSGRPAPGTVFTTTATGRLQIRGVTRDVTVQIQGRQSGGTIQVVGSIPVTFSDFGITAPNIPIVTVADQGTIEFQVNLSRG